MASEFVINGPEWKALTDIVTRVLADDDVLREATKQTLFSNRKQVEAARDELKEAAERAKFWVLYIKREGCDHLITIKTRRPKKHEELIAGNEKLLLCAPEHVRVRATVDVLLGTANACCKAIGLHEVMDGGYLSDFGVELARGFWRRCHLHWRKSVGARKAAWRRKGYIAEYAEAPDFRDQKFHEGSKLLYDVEEVEK